MSHAKQRDYYQTPAIMVISNIILSKGHDASEHKPKTNNIMTYVSEMTEGQTLCHAGSCDKAEDCRSGIGMTPDRHLPVTLPNCGIQTIIDILR